MWVGVHASCHQHRLISNRPTTTDSSEAAVFQVPFRLKVDSSFDDVCVSRTFVITLRGRCVHAPCSLSSARSAGL